jgi:TctA family transporter
MTRRSYSTTNYKHDKDDGPSCKDLYYYHMFGMIVIGSGIMCLSEISEWMQTKQRKLYKLPFHIVKGVILGTMAGGSMALIPALGWVLISNIIIRDF